MKTWQCCICAFFLFAPFFAFQGCQSLSAQIPAAGTTLTIGLCEDSDGCSVLVFNGNKGTGQWSNGNVATLTIDTLNDMSVTIQRADLSGTSKGLKATYRGRRIGDWMDGIVSVTGRGAPVSIPWHAAIQHSSGEAQSGSAASNPKDLVTHLMECQDQGDCTDWTFHGNRGIGRWKMGNSDLTIVQKDLLTLTIRRTDSDGPPASRGAVLTYNGLIKGNHIEGVYVYVIPGRPAGAENWYAITEHLPASFDDETGISSAVKPMGFNLNGTWLRDESGKAQKVLMHIYQHGDEFRMSTPDPDSPKFEFNYFVGHQKGAQSIEGQSVNSAIPRMVGNAVWQKDIVAVADPDHITLANGTRYYRVSTPDPSDAPCDARNSTRVWSPYAYMRGQVAAKKGDDSAAYCWAHIAAVAGDSQAQAAVAGILLGGGPTVKADKPAAFVWAKKSADQDNKYGLMILERMYRKGEGTPVDIPKADQVKARLAKPNAVNPWEWFLSSNDANAVAGRAVLGGLIQNQLDMSTAEDKAAQDCKNAANPMNRCASYIQYIGNPQAH